MLLLLLIVPIATNLKAERSECSLELADIDCPLALRIEEAECFLDLFHGLLV